MSRHDRDFGRGGDEIKRSGGKARIVKSGNMSLGVNLLAVLVREAARALDADFDIEILEMHHKHKVDAPSGTALLLGRAAAEGRGVDLQAQSVRSRDGLHRSAPARRHRLCDAARRFRWSASTASSWPAKAK